MSTTTAINAAMSVACQLAEGQLAESQLAGEVAKVCRELFGHVSGPGDALWGLQVDVMRQCLAAGGVPTNELAEWLAVQRSRDAAGEAPGELPYREPDADSDPRNGVPSDETSYIGVVTPEGPECACVPIEGAVASVEGAVVMDISTCFIHSPALMAVRVATLDTRPGGFPIATVES